VEAQAPELAGCPHDLPLPPPMPATRGTPSRAAIPQHSVPTGDEDSQQRFLLRLEIESQLSDKSGGQSHLGVWRRVSAIDW
jgi:hypothetical protein